METRNGYWYVKQLRIMASRGRIDDQDVVLLFDIADEMELYIKELEDVYGL